MAGKRIVAPWEGDGRGNVRCPRCLDWATDEDAELFTATHRCGREGRVRVREVAVVAVLLIRAEPGEDGLDAARRVLDQAPFATDDLLASTVRSAIEVDDNA